MRNRCINKKDSEINEICEQLYAIKAVSFGDFTLTSGKKSPYYIDLRLLPSFPSILDKVCAQYIELIGNRIERVDRIVGIATAGLPLASVIANKMFLPMCYVRKTPKKHGRKRMIEGVIDSGDHVVIVDDLITTGGSILRAVEAIRDEASGIVEHCVVLIDREQGGPRLLKNNGVTVHALLKISAFVEKLRQKNLIEKDRAKEIIDYVRMQNIR